MLDVLLTSLCLKINDVPEASKYYSSCVSVTRATSLQVKIAPNKSIKNTLDGLEQDFNNKIKAETGEKIWFIAGIVYTLEQTGYITYNFSARPIVDSVTLQSKSDTSSLTLNWSW